MIERLSTQAQGAPKAEGQPSRPARGNFADWLEAPAQEAPEGTPATPDSAISVETGAVPWAGEAVVQFHFRQGPGGLEVVSVPWRLAAQGSLSQRGANAPAAWPVATMAPASERLPGSLRSSPDHGIPGVPDPARLPGGFDALPAMPMPPRHDAAGSAGKDAGPPSLAGSAPAAGAMPWLARMVRWLEQKGHDPAVWVRDYRLEPAEADELAAALRTHAREHGITLERIVVNGRELWNARATNQQEAR